MCCIVNNYLKCLPNQLIRMFKKSGFKDVSYFSNFDKEYSVEISKLYLIGIK